MSSSENLKLKKQALYSELVAYAGKLKLGNSELAAQIARLSKSITKALSSEKPLSR
jgi:vacuolar-type H+-ATPase subunit D/Vma8